MCCFVLSDPGSDSLQLRAAELQRRKGEQRQYPKPGGLFVEYTLSQTITPGLTFREGCVWGLATHIIKGKTMRHSGPETYTIYREDLYIAVNTLQYIHYCTPSIAPG